MKENIIDLTGSSENVPATQPQSAMPSLQQLRDSLNAKLSRNVDRAMEVKAVKVEPTPSKRHLQAQVAVTQTASAAAAAAAAAATTDSWFFDLTHLHNLKKDMDKIEEEKAHKNLKATLIKDLNKDNKVIRLTTALGIRMTKSSFRDLLTRCFPGISVPQTRIGRYYSEYLLTTLTYLYDGVIARQTANLYESTPEDNLKRKSDQNYVIFFNAVKDFARSGSREDVTRLSDLVSQLDKAKLYKRAALAAAPQPINEDAAASHTVAPTHATASARKKPKTTANEKGTVSETGLDALLQAAGRLEQQPKETSFVALLKAAEEHAASQAAEAGPKRKR